MVISAFVCVLGDVCDVTRLSGEENQSARRHVSKEVASAIASGMRAGSGLQTVS